MFNNVYTTSLQDTVYAGSGGCGSPCTVSRQYWWNGKITGDVDYIFGDAAAVFDHDNIYTTYHGATATGTETIEAQNKAALTGGASDYLSGYIFNHSHVHFAELRHDLALLRPTLRNVLDDHPAQLVCGPGRSGRLDRVQRRHQPAHLHLYGVQHHGVHRSLHRAAADINGVIYLGTGGSSGSGVTGTRETTSADPGNGDGL